MFRALMLKELVLLRATLVAALIIAVIMYGIVLPWVHFGFRIQPQNRDVNTEWAITAMYALVMTSLLAAGFAGTMSSERRERWADFAAMLPVSIVARVAAKFVVGASLFLLITGVHAVVLTLTDVLRSPPVAHGPTVSGWELEWIASRAVLRHGHTAAIVGTFAASLAMFGIAWLLAAFMRSPTIVFGSAVGVLLIGLIVTLVVSSTPGLHDEPAVRAYLTGASAVGALALVGGTIYSVCRVEP